MSSFWILLFSLENRVEKIFYTGKLAQFGSQLGSKLREVQLILDPGQKAFVQDRMIHQIKIMVEIIAEFLQGIDIRADVFDIIRSLRFLCLT